MRVKEIMSKNPSYLSPTATLKEAASTMRKLDCGFLPIGENDRLVGVVTDRDMTIRGVATGKNPEKTSVKEVMTKKVLYCFENDEIEDITHNMSDQQIRRLIVLDKNKRLSGVVSLGDIATKSKDLSLSAEAIREISEENK